MDYSTEVSRRLMVAVDASRFSSRDDVGQHGLEAALLGILTTAAARAGLQRGLWVRQVSGDGELAVLPESEPEPLVVDHLVQELSALLADHNYERTDAARLRLRMAVHHGTVYPAALGYAGQGVVEVNRLLDSQVVRSTLMVSGADLVLALSSRVYQDTVQQRRTRHAPKAFRCVEVRNKEYVGEAYLYVPGTDVHALPLGLHPAAAPTVKPEPAPAPAPAPAPTGTGTRRPTVWWRRFLQRRTQRWISGAGPGIDGDPEQSWR